MSKLVRDRIPEIIRKSGREPQVKRLSDVELKLALKEKLVEEAQELKESGDVYEELADVLEVIDAIVDQYTIDPVKLKKVREEKLGRAGGFKNGFYLIGEDGHKP
jgi:predicted house-cleaning noncanonical NTP pyrophosphatase (MazG superfamily)